MRKLMNKRFMILLALCLSLFQTTITANCDYLVKTKKGFRFNCGKVYYSKVQAKDVNKRLFREKEMVLKLHDRKVTVKFNHYKALSITQRLNKEVLDRLAGGDW